VHPIPWWWAALAAVAVALAARAARTLRGEGAIAAAVLAGVVLAWGGVAAAVPLLVAFATASLLTRVGATGERRGRDAAQVLANGGPAGLVAILAWVEGGGWWYLPYLACWCALAADTWATEVGRLVGGRPRMITSLRAVTPGTSGGITAAGTAASLAGALAVAGSAAAFAPWPVLLVAAGAGFAGSVVDSLLGALIQARYRCPTCNRVGEDILHCGGQGVLAAGAAHFGNEAVNATAILVAAGLAILGAGIFGM